MQQWERDVITEAEELEEYAEHMAELQGMRDLFTTGSVERMAKGRVALDEETQTWKLFWDEAARRFRRTYGYLPIVKARQLLAAKTVITLLQRKR